MSANASNKNEILLPHYDKLFNLLSDSKDQKYAVCKRCMLLEKHQDNINIHIYGADVNDYVTEFDIRAVEIFARYDCNSTVTIVYKNGQLYLLGSGCNMMENDINAKIQSYIMEQIIEYKQILPKIYNIALKDFIITIAKNIRTPTVAKISHQNDIPLPDIFLEDSQHGDSFQP